MENTISNSSSRMMPRFNIIFFILFALLLSSCSHISRHDGPPNFYVDETKIPNAVPKPEPLSKYGNMESYRVFGKRYYPMKSSKNYQAVGVASWYGTQFHAHSTSSGERYNMLGMTAAHKTLPLPTYVEVTNLKNHRKVIVKVNDRGPFESNRLIDLSYVAAKKLGMIGHGTSLVRVTAIDPYRYGHTFDIAQKTPPRDLPYASASFWESPHPAFNASNKILYLQVGAFRNKSRAEKLQQRLTAMLHAPVKISRPDNSSLYHVQVGPFRDVVTADRMHQRLKNLGMKPNKTRGA